MLAPPHETYWLPSVPAPEPGAKPRAVPGGVFRAIVLCILPMLIACAPARADTGQDYAARAGAELVGRSVPPLVLTTIDGATIDLDRLRGRKAVYLKFWATWCSPCREQMPHFERIQQHAGDDLQVVAINIGFDDTVEQIEAFRREYGISMPIVRDDDGKLGGIFGLRVTPQHVVIGKDGRIAYVGHLADARLEAALTAARAEPAVRIAGAASAPTTPSAARSGQTSDNITAATTIDGERVALTDPEHRRHTRLAFFSPWCEGYFAQTRPQASAQCRALRERLAGEDSEVRWIGVSFGVWTSEADVREFRYRQHIGVPLVLDRDGQIFRRFGVHDVPAVVELDAQGNVVRTNQSRRAAKAQP